MLNPIGVLSIYDSRRRKFFPYKLKWNNRYYRVDKVCYHHMIREGRTPIHIFHVTGGNLDFRISFNTETLTWNLEEIYDESASV